MKLPKTKLGRKALLAASIYGPVILIMFCVMPWKNVLYSLLIMFGCMLFFSQFGKAIMWAERGTGPKTKD